MHSEWAFNWLKAFPDNAASKSANMVLTRPMTDALVQFAPSLCLLLGTFLIPPVTCDTEPASGHGTDSASVAAPEDVSEASAQWRRELAWRVPLGIGLVGVCLLKFTTAKRAQQRTQMHNVSPEDLADLAQASRGRGGDDGSPIAAREVYGVPVSLGAHRSGPGPVADGEVFACGPDGTGVQAAGRGADTGVRVGIPARRDEECRDVS